MGTWEKNINSTINKKIYVFFLIAPDTIKKYSWDTLIKEKNYLQVDSFDVAKLTAMNWEITYKGDK